VAAGLAGLPALAAGCVPDSVAPGYYVAPDAESEASMVSSVTTDDASTDAPATVTTASDAGAPPPPDASGPCDLTGRWLVTSREVATAIGAVEAAHTWRYYEIAQTGAALKVTKGLNCGANVRGVSAVAANVDYPKSWPGMQEYGTDTGRTGTSAKTASGCEVSFAKVYQVIGATNPYYDDPSTTMPTVSQQASMGNPGWEDWDNDGNPGITMNVTGLATGQLYLATRAYTQWTGTVALSAATFDLNDDWDTEQDVLGYNGSELLTMATSGVRDTTAMQFTEFARLGSAQATGDDDAICAAVRTLAPTLTPDASN
jgi:hypothetical protein